MQQCPRCGSGVPDGRDTCHICKGPLKPVGAAPKKPAQPAQEPAIGLAAQQPIDVAAPGPLAGEPEEEGPDLAPGIPGLDNQLKQQDQYASSAPAQMGGPQMRTTLAGDVVEVSQPEAAPFPGTGGAKQAFPGTGGGPIPPSRSMGPTTMGHPRSAGGPIMASERKSGGGGGGGVGAMVFAILLVLVLAGGGGGWWWWQKQHAPAVAAEKYFAAFTAKDWKTVYEGTDIPAEYKDKVTPEVFAKGMDYIGNLVTLSDVKVGECTITGDQATVKVSYTAAVFGQTKTNNTDLPMKLVDGRWKVSGKLPANGGKAQSLPGM